MTQSLFNPPFFNAFYQGTIATGAKMFFYETETLAPIDILDDSGDPLPNPISADLFGQFVPIYIGDDVGEYRVQLTTSTGIVIDDVDPTDNIFGELAGADGSTRIGYEASGSTTVRTVFSKLSDFISVLDYGAVGDATWSGGVAAGTNDTAAFTAAFTAAYVFGKTVWAPAKTYLVDGIALPPGGIFQGEGYVGLGTFLDNNTRKGTILLVNTPSGGSSLKFSENSHGGHVRDMSIFNVGATSGRAVIDITGVLHPRTTDLEYGSLVRFDGSGKILDASTTGSAFETLYGTFINDYCTMSGAASVAHAVSLVGRSTSPNKRSNSNHFFGGDLAGYVNSLEISALVVGAGVIGCSFHGTTFEGVWQTNGSTPYMTVDYVANGSLILGNSIAMTAYSVRLVNITDCRQISFHGCYFELGGNPGTYDDGTHGTLTLFPTVWLDNQTNVKAVSLFGCSWNNAYLYDNASFTQSDITTDFHRYSSATATALKVRTGVSTTVPSDGAFHRVPFTLYQGDAYLTWDSINNEAQIHSAGFYQYGATLAFNGWSVAGTSAQIRVVTSAGETEDGDRIPAENQTQFSSISGGLFLFPGDTVHVEVSQNSGSNQDLSGDFKQNRFYLVKVA